MKPEEVEGRMGECPICGHAPIRHVEDGTGATCLVCLAGRQLGFTQSVCTLKFEFKLSKREREQAELADKGSYAPRTMCAVCYCYWEAHSGYLCPSGDSTFLPYLYERQPMLFT